MVWFHDQRIASQLTLIHYFEEKPDRDFKLTIVRAHFSDECRQAWMNVYLNGSLIVREGWIGDTFSGIIPYAGDVFLKVSPDSPIIKGKVPMAYILPHPYRVIPTN